MSKNPHSLKYNIPVSVVIQQASDMYFVALTDREILEAAGLCMEKAMSLETLAQECSHAEAAWKMVKEERSIKKAELRRYFTQLFALRNELAFHFRCICEKNSLPVSVPVYGSRSGAILVQDLFDLALLGKKLIPWLDKSGFDVSRLEDAHDSACALASRLAHWEVFTPDESPERAERDRLYFEIRQVLCDVREVGRRVFHNHPRAAAYSDSYKRASRRKCGARKQRPENCGQRTDKK